MKNYSKTQSAHFSKVAYKKNRQLALSRENFEIVPNSMTRAHLEIFVNSVEVWKCRRDDIYMHKHYFDKMPLQNIVTLTFVHRCMPQCRRILNAFKIRVKNAIVKQYGFEPKVLEKYKIMEFAINEFAILNPEKSDFAASRSRKLREDIIYNTNCDVENMLAACNTQFGDYLKEQGFFLTWSELEKEQKSKLTELLLENSKQQKLFYKKLCEQVITT